jgi:hypothetical protein
MLLGIIFIVIVVFMPEGIVPGLNRLFRSVRLRRVPFAPNLSRQVESKP